MKTLRLPQIIAVSLTTLLFLGSACSSAKTQSPADRQAQNHEQHHPEIGQVAPNINDQSDMMKNNGMMGGRMMNNGSMGKMDMSQMMGMMQQCTSKNNDDKMCHQQSMEKCQANMDKQECSNMDKQECSNMMLQAQNQMKKSAKKSK